MATKVSTKGITMSKLETWMGLTKEGFLPQDRLDLAVKEGLEKGEIAPQTEEAFAERSAELLEFAKKLNLIKAKSVAFGKKGKDFEDYIREQHPETIPLFDAVKQLTSKSYVITTDAGESLTIQPLPFCRNITPKPAKPAETPADATPSESSVTV
jgi:hypothetical protein